MSLTVLALVGGFVVTAVRAATFQGPTAEPPAGNIPVTIWNATASGMKQMDSTIDISGTLSLGDTSLDLGVGAGGQNLVYGYVPIATMHTDDNLLLLETESSGVWTPRMEVDGDGNVIASGDLAARTAQLGSDSLVLGASENLVYGNIDTASTGSLLLLQKESGDRFEVDGDGNVTAAGGIRAEGCFGASFIGITVTGGDGSGAYQADVGSYYAANNKCENDYAGAHVCTVNEMLESIRCSVPTDPIRSHGGVQSWVNGGPPGFTADANDCVGWSTASASAYGRFWWFNDTTGGFGTMTSCNAAGLPFACCR